MRCTEARRNDDPLSKVFRNGAATFFYKGTNGRWVETLTSDDLALYEDAASGLDPALRAWLEGGRHVHIAEAALPR